MTASAKGSACAWVLWSITKHEWTIENAYESAQECKNQAEIAQRKSVELRQGLMEYEHGKDWQKNKELVMGVVEYSSQYKCLPDTIDPRSPKR
jgi:hypothetical protein